ncbi:protein arginine N-methyltransferase 1 [Ischnura elegans]|uniref:protein arginine N-methyltransferase 1 n=1 Tax=Ischnura elegans TaxID=197161 RepID=UPI001ED8769A|nr:protein arginine N-methyltransferase 1 [Ischnura elegans]
MSMDSDSDGWDEVDEKETVFISCIFCGQQQPSLEYAVSHCKTDHQFNLSRLKHKFKMDCYSYIKLINFIRSVHAQPSVVMKCTQPLWEDDKYMKPSVPDDPWLMLDFEDLPEETDGDAEVISLPKEEILKAEIEELKKELESVKQGNVAVVDAVREMRQVMQGLVGGDEVEKNTRQKKPHQGSGECDDDEDDSYFGTYAHFGIHHEMLSDKSRTEAYQAAFYQNKDAVNGKVVLDVGCGTGILSLFASKAGAAKVFAIDKSEIAYSAMDIIRENGHEEKIKVLRGRLEDFKDLPKVDIIVSEWMGYFLLFEGMLDSVLMARDQYLSKGGLMLPNRCSLHIVGVHDEDRHSQLLAFWSDVYGFKMSCMQRECTKEAMVELVNSSAVFTSSSALLSLDLNSCTAADACFSSEFELVAERDGSLTALVGYFDVHFDLSSPVILSTSPLAPATHWKQTLFLLEEPIPLTSGSKVNGVLECSRQAKNPRALKITIALQGHKAKVYYLN